MCEVSRPSQSTGVKFGKKKECYFLSCLWSKVQHICMAQLILKLLFVYNKTSSMYLYVKLNRYANCSFQSRAKTVRVPLRMSRERCQLEDVRILFTLDCRLSAERTFSQKPRNLVPQKLEHLDDAILRVHVNAFGTRVFLQNIYTCSYRCWSWRSSVLFLLVCIQFLVRTSIKGRKIKRLDASYMIEIRRF